MINILAGAVAPENLPVSIRPDGDALDLTTVESVTLRVRTPNTTRLWPLEITSQSSSLISGRYAFAVGDVDSTGDYHVLALLHLAGGGTRRAGISAFRVTSI